MYNCLQKKSAKLLKKRTLHRLLASLFVFMMILTGAQAETYYWVGADIARWNDVSNWNTQADGSGTSPTSSLSTSDEVIISSTNAPLISDTDFTTNPVSSITIQNGASLYINSSVDLTSTTLTNNGTLYFCHNTNTSTFTLTIENHNLGNLVLWGQTEIVINGTVSAASISMALNSHSNITENFTAKLSGSGSLSIGNSSPAVNLTRASETAGVIGTFEIDVDVNCAGTIETHSGVTLKIDSGKTLTAGGITHSANNGSPASKIENFGTIDVGTTGTIDLSGNNNAGCTQLVNSGTINAGTIKIGNTDTKEYNNTGITNPIINNGTIEVSSSFTLPNFSNTGTFTPYSGNGQITLNGTNASFENKDTSHEITINSLEGTQSSIVKGGGKTTITTAEFTGAADISGSTITTATFHDNITLSGANTFTSVTATGLGGKTLTVNAEQTFQSGGTVTLSGTGDSNLLTVTGNGSGKFTLGSTTLTGEYLSLNTDSSVVSASTGTAFAQNSETTGSGTTSWIVTSAGGHLWNGENGNWETAANWLPQSVPATTDEVIINSGTPKINSAVTVKSITVNGGGINLSAGSLTLEAISLATATSVTAATSTTINITEDQEIDEKIIGAGKLVLASGKNYTIPPSTTIGIDIENNGSLSSTGAVTFSGDFTNTSSATFTGGLSIAGDLEDTGSLTGAITFNGTTNQTFTPNNVIYPGITVNKSAGTFSVASSLQVTNLTLTSGAVSINGDLTLWDGTDYQNYDFSSVAGTLTFTGGSSASPRVLQAAAITNSSKISADYLKLQAQGSSDITLNSCENISNLTLETSGNISVNGITADSLSIVLLSVAASVKMKDTITLSSTSQDFIIDYPLLLTGDTTFSIIKDIKVQGTGSIKSDTSSGKNLSLTANAIQLLNGNALGDSTTGALGTISINNNLTLGADTQLYSSQINFAGTGAKSLSGAYKLSASGNVSDTGAWTWDTGSTLLFNGTSDQTFKTNTNSTYKDIAVNKTTGNFIIDTSVLKADNLTITDCEEIHFTGANEITTVANLSFTKPVTADNNLTISNTSGNVSFTDIFNSTGNLNITDVSVTFGGNVTAAAISTKATTINCSKIQSSGNQNYAGAVTLGANTELESSSGNISFTSTVDGTNTLKLTSSTGTSFGGNVGASTSLTSLEINGTSNINCASITTSGDQTYNGTVNLEAGGTTTITGANTGAHIDFKDTINGSNTFSVTAASTTFENTVGATTALASLEVTGTATINCSSIKTSDLQTYNDEIILQQDSSFTGSLITLNGSVSDNTTPANSYALTVNGNAATALGNSETISIPVQINGNLTNANTGTASFNNDIKVTGNVTDNGNWTSADGKKLIFNGTGDQIFTPVATTNYKSILIDKSAGSFTTATNALQVSSFADSATNASTITFATDTTIGSDVEFHTSKDVSFTNITSVLTAGSPNVYHNITHEKGITNLSGTVTAANITLHKANLTGATTLIAHGDVEFKNIGTSSYANIYGSNDLTITVDTGKSVTFNGDVGKAGNPIPTALTVNGNTNIKCTLIATSGTQSYNGNVNLYSNSTNSSVTLTTNTSSEIDFSGDISEDSSKQIKLTIDSPFFKSRATAENSSSITVNELEFLQDTSIQTANTTAISLTVPKISGSGKTVSLAASVSELSFNGEVEFYPNITTAASSNFKASSGTMSFKADVNFADNTLAANNGTIILTAANKTPAGTAATLSGNNTFKTLTLQGPVTLSGSNTITDLNIQDSVTLSAGNTITNLTANTPVDGTADLGLGGKTITFGAGTEQIVTNLLSLKGSANMDGNRLMLRSSIPTTTSGIGTQWKIKCTGANAHVIQYVDVQDSLNESETGSPTATAYNLFALDSLDHGNNTKWNFPGMKYEWSGATNTSWTDASNWKYLSIPGKGADIDIPAGCTNYPILITDLDLNETYNSTQYNGKITIKPEEPGKVEGKLDLADCNLTLGEITNNGRIRLAGETGQAIFGTMKNGADSTVEYYDVGSPAAVTQVFAWDGDNGAGTAGKQYENLIINNTINNTSSASADLKVAKNLTINGETTLTGSIEVTGASVINCSSVSTTGNQTYNGTVSLNKTGDITLTAKNTSNINQTLQFNGNVSCAGSTTPNLIINANTNITCASVSTSGSQTYNGSLQIDNPAAIISQTDSLIFNDNVSLAADLSLTANASGKSINFAANISDNGAGKTVTFTTEKLQSTVAAPAPGSATISLATLTLSQATLIGSENAASLNLDVNTINGSSLLTFGLSTATFTLKDGITINPPVTIETGRAVTCAGAALFNNAVTNNGSLAGNTGSQSKTLTFEQDYTSTTGGNLTASSGLTVFRANIDLASTNFTHSSGTVSFAGDGTAQVLTTKNDGSTNFFNVSISSPASVNTSSSFIVSGNSWSNTTTSRGFTAATPSVITFDNSTAPASAPAIISGSNHFFDLVCKTAGQNITFANSNYFDNTITLGDSSASPAIMTGSVIIGSPAPLTFNPDLNCNSLTINGPSSADAPEAVIFSGNASYGDSFASTGSGNVIIKKDFTGNGNASFAGDVILNEDNNRSFSAGANHNITITNNMIIDTDPGNTIQLNTSLSSRVLAANFVLYSGSLTLNGSLETSGDIILLGSDYATTDPQTGIDGIYLYNQTRPSTISYTPAFRAAPYNGQVNALENATMKAGKNFYSNGLTLQGPATGSWKIMLAKTSDSQHGFAEAIKTSVSNCAVTCHELPSNTATDNTAPAKIAAYECTDNSGNTNWNFEDFVITDAWTERDNSIYVAFNAPVRNIYNEINNYLNYFTYQGSTGPLAFTGIYTEPDCQEANQIVNADIELTNGSYSFFLKASDSWNTDATGRSSGTTESSTDRHGIHKSCLPYIDIPRSLTAAAAGTSTNLNYLITNKWGKRLNNYSTRTPTPGFAYGTNENSGNETYVLDKTGPVLWSVRTGQELHDAYNSTTGQASQHSYDSHNFLEFRYSEPVDFGSTDSSICDVNIPAYTTSPLVNTTENIQVTDRFGAISENITAASASLTLTGLALLQAPAGSTLKLYTGRGGSPDKYMNALYRTDEYSLRLSIAGWTDGTVTDYTGNAFKKWPGYIEEATQFAGAKAKHISTINSLVKDQAGNPQIAYAVDNFEPNIYSNSTEENPSSLLPIASPRAPADLYSEWDLSSPVFTPLRFSSETLWGEDIMSEAIGNTNGTGSTLDRIDFHFFDNTPSYSTTGANADPAEWFTEIGWCIPGSEAAKENLKDYSYTYCADIIGGARQFDTDANRRTSGGIRFSTKLEVAPAFKYSTSPDNPSPDSSFLTGSANTHTTVISQLFTGSSTPMRPANDPDGLYLGLGLTDTSLSVETTFAFSYNESQGYLTDLAGNRLRSKLSRTIDRTPPSFDIILSPIDTKSVYIIFVKQIVTDAARLKLRNNDGTEIAGLKNEIFTSLLPRCFRLVSIDDNGYAHASSEIQIDTTVPAQLIEKNTNSSFTCFKLTTTKEINIENVKNLYVQLVMPPEYPERTVDPFTSNINSRVTLIQDNLGNYMSMYCAHALSDFAINYVNPLYAYSSDMLDDNLSENQSVMNGLYEEGSWAVHDWNSSQQKYGSLPADHPISIVADTKAEEKIRIYLSPSPDAESVSKQFNSDFSTKLRVWLPSLSDGLFRSLAAVNNTNFVYADGSLLEEGSQNDIFSLTKETVSAWQSGNQITFMFGLMDSNNNPVRIYNTPYYDIEADKFNLANNIPVPLYSLRMTDLADINTLDLWSFKLRGITSQRGGVTILNNVIDAGKGEKTVIKVDLPEAGKLSVIVMTLDGNIITYLNRGNAEAGEHYFTWNGKNKSGNPVARGMYFVRVTGSGIDETRKVMVVKD